MVGVVCGLAWTEAGGDMLFIEASVRKGKKELILTGNMGNIMKESAQAALSYIKARGEALGIDDAVFDDLELHIHVPQGAIPKDGPSAGITMAVAMISALTGRPVDRKIAMTGEITLTGRVLPIGGLKEKTLAALRAGIGRIIIPEDNARELEEMPPYVKKAGRVPAGKGHGRRYRDPLRRLGKRVRTEKGRNAAGSKRRASARTVREASFYEKREGRKVACFLCRHHCLIPDGKRGICCVRENQGGTLYTLVYGNPCAWHVDPIEKKPLYHFFPGSKAFSIATVGCNFRCLHCQNHEISQLPRERRQDRGLPHGPGGRRRGSEAAGCRSISYTYTEPTMFYEYASDIARLAKAAGIYNNFVTNGYIEAKPLEAIRPYLDAANIDLKSMSDGFYRKVCGAKLKGVLASIKTYKSLGIWVELTTSIIPKYNDSEDEFARIAAFIRDEVGVETPWHVSAFYPTYKLKDSFPTPAETLIAAREIGLEAGLRYVYTGNIPGIDGENTYCYACKKPVITRSGFTVTGSDLEDGHCRFCKAKIDGVGL